MIKRILIKLPLTKFKIFFAKILYFVTKIFIRSDKQIVLRKGIKYELDLTEGIDLSIYLFGGFQKHVFNNKNIKLTKNPIIFDIGANIGHMSLTYAKLFINSNIYSFEPTDYAYEKFIKNLELNQNIAKQIFPIKAFLSDKTEDISNIKAYSSWKIAKNSDNQIEIHKLHKGTSKTSSNTPSYKLDDFVEKNSISKIDFIKIDTDGHEIEVFKGAYNTIKKFKPYIVFEAGLYVLYEKNLDFNVYFEFLKDFKYTLINISNGHEINTLNYLHEIPEKSTIDVLIIFNKD